MSTLAPVKLHEAGGRIPFREGTGDKYKVRIMGWEPGAEVTEGSSALYPVAALKQSVPLAFPEGTRMRANHDGICEAGGDIRRVIARTLDTPWEEADGMYTNMRVSSEWSSYVKEYGDIIGLSISAAGELEMYEDEDGEQVPVIDEATGKKVLKRLLTQEESPYNSIDFVEAPGADGRIVLALESARGHMAELNIREQAKFAAGITEKHVSKAVPPKNERKEYSMDEKEQAAFAATVAEATANATAAAIAEALKPAEQPKEVVKGEAVAEAAFAAGLSTSSREAVYERVAGGSSVEDAIAKEKAREDEIESRVKESFKDSGSLPGYSTGVSESTKGINDEFDALVSGGIR